MPGFQLVPRPGFYSPALARYHTERASGYLSASDLGFNGVTVGPSSTLDSAPILGAGFNAFTLRASGDFPIGGVDAYVVPCDPFTTLPLAFTIAQLAAAGFLIGALGPAVDVPLIFGVNTATVPALQAMVWHTWLIRLMNNDAGTSATQLTARLMARSQLRT